MDFSDIPWNLIIEILGFLTGLLYLWWEYNADNRLWFVSMVMPFISMWIYFNKGLYADFGLSIYYLLIAVYGYIVWTRKNRRACHAAPGVSSRGERGDGEHVVSGDEGCKDKGDDDELPITHTPGRMIWVCAGMAVVLWGALYLGLNYLTDSTVPLADAFTTALSIVGMWMLARKYIEQWLVWVAVDLVSTGLYFYKGIFFYSLLYAIYTVIACLGYRKWLRLMR